MVASLTGGDNLPFFAHPFPHRETSRSAFRHQAQGRVYVSVSQNRGIPPFLAHRQVRPSRAV